MCCNGGMADLQEIEAIKKLGAKPPEECAHDTGEPLSKAQIEGWRLLVAACTGGMNHIYVL